ncbi:MAG TPA: hypothetical protein VM121_00865 [Acidimicrobiales bacterium]|nr:hypothetical protein [Acidimicrobiales bacterium]
MIRRRCAALVLWFGLLALVIAGLHIAGESVLRTPGMTASAGWSRWLIRTDPVVTAFALLRLVMLAAAWYTLAVTTATAAAHFGGSGALVAAVDRLTVPALRRLLAMTVSASVATGSFGALVSPAGAQPVDPPATVTMHRLGEGEALPTMTPTSTSTTTAATTSTTATTAAGPVPAAGTAAPSEPASSVPRAAREWRVERGDCFWTIAESVLTASAGRAPSDAEIVPYWRRLIEANRAVLGDRNNPDLIFPGQIFTVPPP